MAVAVHPRAQEAATELSGDAGTPLGILSDEAALAELSPVLGDACAATKAKP